MVGALRALLAAVPADAPAAAYEAATLEANILGKDTDGARKRTFRYLKELYVLRPDALLFRALRDLWPLDREAQPLLAGLCALARDSVYRASSRAIIGSAPGDEVSSTQLAEAVHGVFPDSYGDSTLAKIGRNTFSSWEQTGHLRGAGRSAAKVRTRAACRPANVAYALILGHLTGARGKACSRRCGLRCLTSPAPTWSILRPWLHNKGCSSSGMPEG